MNFHSKQFLPILLSLIQQNQSFFIPKTSITQTTTKLNNYVSLLSPSPKTIPSKLYSSNEEDEEEDPLKYWKEQYPELEFVNYNDPEYAIDQGTEEVIPILSPNDHRTKEEIEIQIEEMREERRRKNDIYQFETYYKNIWKSGNHEYYGEWTVYDTILGKDTDESLSVKSLRKRKDLQKVISKASKMSKEDLTVITHSEECTEGKDVQRYYPKEILPFDFRGPQGIMTVGNAYTICDTTLLADNVNNEHSGPYKTMNAEVGLYKDNLRLRLKLSYSINEEEQQYDDSIISTHPPLYLQKVIICRESTLDFPNPDKHTSLYESLGAPGGIYDPPPIIKENQYLQLELEGRATALFPSKIDQDVDDGGWVMTLDWTTDELRYQADRKVFGGLGIKGLYRLELSEVRSEDSEMWRPKKGPQDMRQ